MDESLQDSLQAGLLAVAELLLVLAVALLATRWLFGYVARFAAWIDSGFQTSPGPVTTGSEGMLLRRGVARTPLDPRGKVRVGSELWHAEASEPVPAGSEVEILAVEGLTLRVAARRKPQEAQDARKDEVGEKAVGGKVVTRVATEGAR